MLIESKQLAVHMNYRMKDWRSYNKLVYIKNITNNYITRKKEHVVKS